MLSAELWKVYVFSTYHHLMLSHWRFCPMHRFSRQHPASLAINLILPIKMKVKKIVINFKLHFVTQDLFTKYSTLNKGIWHESFILLLKTDRCLANIIRLIKRIQYSSNSLSNNLYIWSYYTSISNLW